MTWFSSHECITFFLLIGDKITQLLAALFLIIFIYGEVSDAKDGLWSNALLVQCRRVAGCYERLVWLHNFFLSQKSFLKHAHRRWCRSCRLLLWACRPQSWSWLINSRLILLIKTAPALRLLWFAWKMSQVINKRFWGILQKEKRFIVNVALVRL